MSELKLTSNPKVQSVFDNYSEEVREKISNLRNLIIETAQELELEKLEETLKWGEPSYIAKHGSTIRIDWKAKNPAQYAMYFQCTSKLVPMFKIKFGDEFTYEGTRALIFGIDEKIKEDNLKACIAAALRYHKVKHLPTLGL